MGGWGISLAAHDAGLWPAHLGDRTGWESLAPGAGCSSVALRWWIVRSAKIVLDIKFITAHDRYGPQVCRLQL
jgi:hypothetical protein